MNKRNGKMKYLAIGGPLTAKAAFITLPRSSILSSMGIMEIQVARLAISPTTE